MTNDEHPPYDPTGKPGRGAIPELEPLQADPEPPDPVPGPKPPGRDEEPAGKTGR